MLDQYESELLSAYADNELIGEELVRVQKQLAISIEWREEFENLQKTKQLTLTLPRIPAPVDLFDYLEDQTRKHLERDRFRIWKNFTFSQPMQRWAWGTTMAFAASTALIIGVHHVHQKSFIPLEPLMAAHNHNPARSPISQGVIDASNYTSQLKDYGQN